MTVNSSMSTGVEWDVRNWSKAVDFWLQHLDRPIEGARVLEVGGRDGALSVWFASQGAASVVCTDLTWPSERAMERFASAGMSGIITAEAADATALPYREEFDLVVFKSVIGGVGGAGGFAAQQRALASMRECLRPGGQLLFAENLVASPAHQYARRRFVRWGQSWRYLSMAEVQQLLTPFDRVELMTAGCLGAFGRTERQRDLLARVDTVALDRWFPPRWHYIVAGVATRGANGPRARP